MKRLGIDGVLDPAANRKISPCILMDHLFGIFNYRFFAIVCLADFRSTQCDLCFVFGAENLPRPLRAPSIDFRLNELSLRQRVGRKRKHTSTKEAFLDELSRLRADRATFKTVSICLGMDIEYVTKPLQRRTAQERFGRLDDTVVDYLKDPLFYLRQAVLNRPHTAEAIPNLIARVLKIDAATVVENLEDLRHLGLDSLHALEICLYIEEELGVNMPESCILLPECQASFGTLVREALAKCER